MMMIVVIIILIAIIIIILIRSHVPRPNSCHFKPYLDSNGSQTDSGRLFQSHRLALANVPLPKVVLAVRMSNTWRSLATSPTAVIGKVLGGAHLLRHFCTSTSCSEIQLVDCRVWWPVHMGFRKWRTVRVWKWYSQAEPASHSTYGRQSCSSCMWLLSHYACNGSVWALFSLYWYILYDLVDEKRPLVKLECFQLL